MSNVSNKTPRSYYGRDGRNGYFEGKRSLSHDKTNPEHERPGSNFYEITIPDRHKYKKNYITNSLFNYVASETLVPIKYRKNRNGANFFVDDKRVAIALLDCNITTTLGQKLTVRVTRPPFPRCTIDEEFKERVKQAMMKRYVPVIEMIDLSRFHRDPDLISDYFCALSCPPVLDTVFNVLSEHMPDLKAINLHENILDIDATLRMIKQKLLKLKILHIGDNKIKAIEEINAIKDLKLEELILTGNPICNEYQSQKDYIEDVQKLCPELLRLDGMDLPKPVLSDAVDDRNTMPASEKMVTANAQAQQIAIQFLQQYLLIFDSENREPLLNAYTRDACFSMTVFDAHNLHNPNKLNGYIMDDGKLCRMNSTDKGQKLLKRLQGHFAIVKYLYEMPRTFHYLNTLTMISLIAETMLFVTLTGMFKQLDKKEQPIHYFNRTFTIIPEGTGYCIKNEQLHITQPTEAQLKQLNIQSIVQKNDAEANTAIPEVHMSESETQTTYPEEQITVTEPHMADPQASPISSTTITSPVLITDDVKQQMIVSLCQQTGMNFEWSLKCLLELSWNYDNAFSAFQTFQMHGQIPAEAFS